MDIPSSSCVNWLIKWIKIQKDFYLQQVLNLPAHTSGLRKHSYNHYILQYIKDALLLHLCCWSNFLSNYWKCSSLVLSSSATFSLLSAVVDSTDFGFCHSVYDLQGDGIHEKNSPGCNACSKNEIKWGPWALQNTLVIVCVCQQYRQRKGWLIIALQN